MSDHHQSTMATAAAEADDLTDAVAKKTAKEVQEKEFSRDNLRPVEEFVMLADRIPTYLLIFFSRFRSCRRFAFEALGASNTAHAVFFAGRLLLCGEDIFDYDLVFYCERVAFVFAALCYCFEVLIFGKIAAVLYLFTNMLLIKSIFDQVNDLSGFLALAYKKYHYITYGTDFSEDEEENPDSDRDENEPELENEPPLNQEIQQSNPETLKEEGGKDPELENESPLNQEIQQQDPGKDPELQQQDPGKDPELENEPPLNQAIPQQNPGALKEEDGKDPDTIYDFILDEEEEADNEKNAKGYEKNILELLNDEYEQQCLKLEEEKNDLTLKLTESVELYRGIQKVYFEHQIMCDKEKRELVAKLEENVDTLKHYQHIVHEHIFNNSTVANAAAAAGVDESTLQLRASLASARASLYDYQTMYQNSMNESEEKRLKWEQERNELNAKLSATLSWYQYYVLATYDYQLQNHNLLAERNDLSVKLHSANASAEFYKACLDDSDEECRKLREENGNISAKLFAEASSAERYHNLVHELEEKKRKLEDEKNELVTKLCAAKAASALYRSYLHDLDVCLLD